MDKEELKRALTDLGFTCDKPAIDQNGEQFDAAVKTYPRDDEIGYGYAVIDLEWALRHPDPVQVVMNAYQLSEKSNGLT